ncbi:MAG: peroxide stress protein YaaA [Actinobacteria bacterium]|nr:peroxide stress protein YaaA [Actinomycetota bacterium]NCX16394.1 peroxide stress protein YaaA [Actinomycetota bacterium]NDC17343.1 peroxide stress protein YaaA [Actinomycetota bacterium]
MSVSPALCSPILTPMLILLPPSEKKGKEPGPAITVYAGVLYQGLGWATLTQAAQVRAQKSIAIISAKYGSLKCLDPIEPYKEKIDSLHMRGPITQVLDAIEIDLVIDCRSSTYQSVWTPPAHKCVEIKVFSKVDGVKKVITHMSKKVRGEVTRLLLLYKMVPTNPQELAEIVSTEFECELFEAKANKPWVLEVIAH